MVYATQFHGIPYMFVLTEFHILSNENSSVQPITKNPWKLVLYFIVNTVHKQLRKKTKEKCIRDGICRRILRNSVHVHFNGIPHTVPAIKIASPVIIL
jgi:hypothetical protein